MTTETSATRLHGQERVVDLRWRRVAPLLKDGIDRERAAWKERIDNLHINNDVSALADVAFDRLIHRAQTKLEGQCLVFAAPSGAGKTHLLLRLLKRPELQPDLDKYGPRTPVVFVKAPAPCTLKSLGLAIYKKLTGEDLHSRLTTDAIWRHVAFRLYGQGTLILVIDEFHHVLGTKDMKSRQIVVNTVKNLLLPEPGWVMVADEAPYPIQLVLSGTPPDLDAVIDQDLQLARRAPRFRFNPLDGSEEGLSKLAKCLELLESRLRLPRPSSLASDDMVRRFLRASDGYPGRAIHLVKEAAYMAIDEGASCIDRHRHLAVACELFVGSPSENPFVVADISSLRKPKKPTNGERTRLRGADRRIGHGE